MSDQHGFADTPGPDATPDQDADVRALLGFLRDEPLEMPPDVAARLDAVIAEERRTSAAAVGAASALDDDAESSAAPLAPVTVLPVATRRRGPSMTSFKVLGGVAAAALVVVGGINLVGGLGASTSLETATSSSGASAAPSVAAGGTSTDSREGGTRLTASGATYTPSLLAAQASTLAGISLGTVKAADATAGSVTGEGSTPGPAASPVTTTQATGAYSVAAAPTDARALASATVTTDKVASCVATLTDGDGTQAVAVDAGTWQGKPALLVILPTKGDATSLDVLVVTRDCSPSFLTFQRIPRP
jgi:hypothetical protein